MLTLLCLFRVISGEVFVNGMHVCTLPEVVGYWHYMLTLLVAGHWLTLLCLACIEFM
jgi:hypothetical protein